MNEWPSSAEIDAMPDDVLRQWFWQPMAALTTAHQSLIRRAAERLYHPPAVAPVYRFIEPVAETEKPEPKPVKKAKPVEAVKVEPTQKPEEDSLALFKSLFRTP